jgi:hypothetical protein
MILGVMVLRLLHVLAAALKLHVIGVAAFAIGGHLDLHAALGAAKSLALLGRLRPRRAFRARLAHFFRHGTHGYSSKKGCGECSANVGA